MEGNPKFEESQSLPDFDYGHYAQLCGLAGVRMDHPDRVAGTWEVALAADRPVVVDAVTDPNVPPLPPHITWEQAKAMMSSLIKGDPDASEVVKQSFKGIAAEYIAT